MSRPLSNKDATDPYRVTRRDGLSDAELQVCLDLLGRGGAVDTERAAKHLPVARVQVVATLDDVIVGVGAIKLPRPGYALKIARDSGHGFDPRMPELGYVTVDRPHRCHQLSSRIVAALLATEHGPLFATTDKDAMKTVLHKNAFVQYGHQWDGNMGCLSLWLRPGRKDGHRDA